MQRRDTGLVVPGFDAGRHGVGEGPLEGHHLGPIDARLGDQPLAGHRARPLDPLGHPDQHLLGVAASQGAGAAVRKLIDDGHLPAFGSGHARHAVAAGARTDHDQVEVKSVSHKIP